MGKYVFSFNEGTKEMRELLGGKGANLSEMTRIGLPVPFGFTISTLVCNAFFNKDTNTSKEIVDEMHLKIKDLQEVTGKKFGDAEKPLIVSVRSGSSISMPGMMDTILNLGLNDETVEGLSQSSGDRLFALDSYCKFIETYGSIVLRIDKNKFAYLYAKVFMPDKKEEEKKEIIDIENVIVEYKKLIYNETGYEFPQDVYVQLNESIKAIFLSWNNDRAVQYRRYNNIPNNIGTAVVVQAMVFGNLGKYSATGVAFSRNPINGKKEVFGEFLMSAQGEDVVSGSKTPQPLQKLQKNIPGVYKELAKILELLEKHFRDMQNVEFTIENNKLYILQSKTAKRTIDSALKIAVEMVDEELITKEEAICRIDAKNLNAVFKYEINDNLIKNNELLGSGLAASQGVISGVICLSTEEVIEKSRNGQSTILVKQNIKSDDIKGIVKANGILSAKGGITSHIAVVARGMEKAIITGCAELIVDRVNRQISIDGRTINEGEEITISSTDGKIYLGIAESDLIEKNEYLEKIMSWTDDIRVLKVRTNADDYIQAEDAVAYGAEGIGLCRTEDLFLDDEHLLELRKFIFSEREIDINKIYEDFVTYQRNVYLKLYEIMGEKSINIRLIDLTTKEIVPKEEKELSLLARELDLSREELDRRLEKIKTSNPTLGIRGSRLIIKYERLVEMQVEAIIRAAIDIKVNKGYEISPEIMIPFISDVLELKYIKEVIIKKIASILETLGYEDDFIIYQIGTLIETPRAALIAEELAENVDFISFGTNDLTQLVYGISREESNSLLEEYLDKDIFYSNPFTSLDMNGVGNLIKMATDASRQKKSNLKIGICGEHASDPETISFCTRLKMNYVSCKPANILLARLVAAQEIIKETLKQEEINNN